ncbi:unnamed protein product [Absidia cylindrospora]
MEYSRFSSGSSSLSSDSSTHPSYPHPWSSDAFSSISLTPIEILSADKEENGSICQTMKTWTNTMLIWNVRYNNSIFPFTLLSATLTRLLLLLLLCHKLLPFSPTLKRPEEPERVHEFWGACLRILSMRSLPLCVPYLNTSSKQVLSLSTNYHLDTLTLQKYIST